MGAVMQGIDFSFWIFQTVAMMVTCFLIPRLRVKGPIPALMTVVVLAFINSHIWSAALFFKIPDTVTHQTLVLLLSNGVIFWLVVKLLPGIEIDGILPALAAPVVFTVCSVLIGTYGSQVDWAKVWEQSSRQVTEFRKSLEDTKKDAESAEKPHR